MIQIKKTILTLVALLAVTTGAWAQGPWTSGECTVTLNNGTLTVSGNGAMDNYPNLDMPWDNNKGAITSVVVESGVTSVGMGAFRSFSNMTSVTLPEGLTAINDLAFSDCSSLQSITIPSTVTSIGGMAFNNCSAMTSVTLSEGLKTIGDMAFGSCSSLTSVTLPEGLTTIKSVAFSSCSSLTSVTIPSTVTSIDDYAFMFSSAISDVNLYANPDNLTWGDTSLDFMSGNATKCHVLAEHLSTYQNKFGSANVTFVGDLQPLASGPEVAWDKAKNSGTFTMPGGNVTLEPDYYPQAVLAAAPTAINDVPATTDGAIVSAGTVANIGETTTAQGTVMYYVSPSPLDDAALLALAADQWTADVPTAADLAQGQAYVYYYVRGNDSDTDEENFSDGDILAANALTVTIAAEPTYAVTFADGVNPEPPADPEWTATPNPAKTKQTVTVTYSGERKVMGVKAEKKGAESLIVNPVVGQIIGSDGKNYDANATLPDGVTKEAMIAYVSGSNGLALALTDIPYFYTWDNTGSYNNGKTAPEICSALNTSKAVTGGTWKLPSQDEWKQMFKANGGNEGSYSGLNTAIGNAGGTALQEYEDYWSSSEINEWEAWLVHLADGNASWNTDGKYYGRTVRACLAF